MAIQKNESDLANDLVSEIISTENEWSTFDSTKNMVGAEARFTNNKELIASLAHRSEHHIKELLNTLDMANQALQKLYQSHKQKLDAQNKKATRPHGPS